MGRSAGGQRYNRAEIRLRHDVAAQDRTSVKLCDFGSAMFQGENEVTPYLVSRYYRSPEVILGLKYGEPPGLLYGSSIVPGLWLLLWASRLLLGSLLALTAAQLSSERTAFNVWHHTSLQFASKEETVRGV